MKTTALLCDHAQVEASGKLYIAGANVSRLNTPLMEPPHRFTFALAVLVEVPWNETNRPHKLTIELVFEGGDHGAELVPIPGTNPNDSGVFVAQFNAGRGPDMVPGETSMLPVAMNFPGLELPGLGGYTFKIGIDGTETAHVPFQARGMGPMGFIG